MLGWVLVRGLQHFCSMIDEPMKTPIYSKKRQTFINLDSVFDFCSFQLTLESSVLSSELGARQAQREVVKIKIFDFAYWA